ncbi:unnamed protein product [Paramecium primaurelia]|uniref:Uncharacterized protein n=1 Tax=Paramecium primaurelia TaxID=5886 RepID=A0A8S1KJL6_PARPR|nr:unnamed protein product [Paramecium primaurelia]
MLFVGIPQQQDVHSLQLGPVHQLHDGQHCSLETQTFLRETYPQFVLEDVKLIQPDIVPGNTSEKFKVLTSNGRVSQNPVVIVQVVGDLQGYEYFEMTIHPISIHE